MDNQALSIVRPVLVKKWATDDDFTAHMNTIYRLYNKERKTLKQVMEHMEREHYFFATCVSPGPCRPRNTRRPICAKVPWANVHRFQ